jgi:hypothetical protein
MTSGLRRAAIILWLGLTLSGCATPTAGSGLAGTESASPSASALPTQTPQPRVALDGDCGAVLPSSAAQGAFESASFVPSSTTSLSAVMPDAAASAALIGALTCAWSVDGSRISHASIDIVPEEAVPAAVLESSAAFACDGSSLCGRAETHDGVWVRAAVNRWVAPEQPVSEEEAAELQNAVALMLASVFSHPSTDLRGVPVEPDPTWWKLAACDLLHPAVVEATGSAEVEPGFPSDVEPSGSMWEVLVANDASRWCAWHSYAEQEPVLVELDLQPGVGAPSSEQLEGARAEAIDIAGADVAYVLRLDDRPTARSTKLVAVVGDNRLTVGGNHIEAVATHVLGALASADGSLR